RLHHASQFNHLLQGAGRTVRTVASRQFHAVLCHPRLWSRLRLLQCEVRQPRRAAKMGRKWATAGWLDSRRRQPGTDCGPVAAAVRVAKVAKVYRQTRHGGLSGEFHLRREIDAGKLEIFVVASGCDPAGQVCTSLVDFESADQFMEV